MSAPAPVTAPPIRRRFWTPGTRDWIIRIVTFVTLILVWEWYARGVNKTLLATPSAVAEAAYRLVFEKRVILPALWTSVSALLVGFVLAVIAGVVMGILMGRIRLMERLFDPYVSFLYAIPSIVFVPLILAWVGLGMQLRVVLVFLAGVFPIIINTMVGVKQVPTEYTDVGRTFCASEWEVLRTIVIPHSLPYVFVGLRQALAQSFVMVIVAEMLVAVTGLGGLMITYSNFFKTAELFVPLFFIMAVSLSLTSLMRWVGNRLAPWGTADR